MLKKENFIFLLFSVVSVLIGIGTTYLLSDYFSVDDFGKIQLLLTYIGVLSLFCLTGFDVVLQKQIFKEDDGFVFYLLKNIMPLSIVILAFFSLVAYIFLDDNTQLLLFACLVTSFSLFDKTSAILNSKLKFKAIRYIELSTKIIILLSVVILTSLNVNLEIYIYTY
ncbi:hypothetical protein F0266_21635, partial [Vibrio coralliilyticus]|uniref:hypothetical protein n=1 Tax=Vibrio coralliilyticus TaxID=190893 RepID=UPI00148DAB12